MSETNGGPQPQAIPQIGVLGQYVKDLSFENPNAPRSAKKRCNCDRRATSAGRKYFCIIGAVSAVTLVGAAPLIV